MYLRNKKWLLCCSYKPHKSTISKHLKEIQIFLWFSIKKPQEHVSYGVYDVEPNQVYIMVNLFKSNSTRALIKPKSFLKSETGLCLP